MKALFYCVGFLLLTVHGVPVSNVQTAEERAQNEVVLTRYHEAREKIETTQEEMRLGGHLDLNEKEQRLNTIMANMKTEAYKVALTEGGFPAEEHFFSFKDKMEQSPIFKILRSMPKGALLHIHKSAMVSLDWVLKNLTTLPNLYLCEQPDDASPKYKTSFFTVPDNSCDWESLETYRSINGEQKTYDRLVSIFSMVDKDKSTLKKLWKGFEEYFSAISGILRYAPAFKPYWQRALEEFYEDGIQYVEIRSFPNPTYELNGTEHSSEENIEILRDLFEEFTENKPDFIRPTFIGTARRTKSLSSIMHSLSGTIEMKKKFPSLIGGFDLIASEDFGQTLKSFAEVYLTDPMFREARSLNLSYVLHAGETDWQGTQFDANILDALLLNATRIGHGFAILQHKIVKDLMKKRDIAIELNPISNHVLGYLCDFREHPGAVLMAEGFPLVLSSDDPPVWGAYPLTSDFYVTYMAFGRDNVDLATLKQLAINSIKYSLLPDDEKQVLYEKWETRWNSFVDQVLDELDAQSSATTQHDEDVAHTNPVLAGIVAAEIINS